MSCNLTKQQMNKLMKGQNVRLKPSQLEGPNMLSLDKKMMSKYKSAVKHSKGLQISKKDLDLDNLTGQGASFKSVMAKVKKGASTVGRELLKQNRKYVDKGLKKVRERGEKEIEDILIGALGDKNKDLIQDLITENSAFLSKKASRQLDKLEGKVDTSMSEMGLVKNRDYAYLNPYDVNPEGLNLPVAEAIEVLKGQGVHRAVYLKGSGAKSFFKKVGRKIAKVVASKPVKNILKNLASQGVSALATSISGNPMVGQMAGNLTKGLTDSAIDKGTNELAGLGLSKGAGRARQTSFAGGAMYMSGMRNRGGAMYGIGVNDVKMPVVGKIRQNDGRKYL